MISFIFNLFTKVLLEYMFVHLKKVNAACKQVASALVVHPPGLDGLTVLHIRVLQQLLNAGEADIATLDTSNGDARGILGVDSGAGGGIVLDMALQKVDRANSKAGGADTVQGRGRVALLNVTKDGGAGIELLVTLLLNNGRHNVGGVGLGCALGPDDDTTLRLALGILTVALAQVTDILLETGKIDALLRDVDRGGTDGESRHHSQETRLASVDLDDKDALPAGGGTLFDGIAGFHDGVQTGVTSQTELSTRDVVADGGGDVDHGHAEGRVYVAGVAHLETGSVGLETTDQDQTLDVELLELVGNHTEIERGLVSVGTKLTSSVSNPAIDIHPLQLLDKTSHESREAVVDTKGDVSTVASVADNSTDGSVHTACGRTDVDDTDAQRVLRGLCRFIDSGGGGDGHELVELLVEGRVTKLHSTNKVLASNGLGDLSSLNRAIS